MKKYKRVRRPKIHVELPQGSGQAKGDVSNGEDVGLLLAASELGTERPKESENNASEGQEACHHLHVQRAHHDRDGGATTGTHNTGGQKERREKRSSGTNGPIGESLGDCDRRRGTLIRPEETTTTDVQAVRDKPPQPQHQKKSRNQSVSDDDSNEIQVQPMAENEGYGEGGVASLADENKSTDESASRHQDAGATPRTSRCSEEEPNAAGGCKNSNDDKKTDKNRDDDKDEGENEEYEEYEEYEIEDDEDGDETLTSGGGSLWFKAERIVITLQFLALALDVYGAPWPPLFVRMWSWVWLTNQYLRWPALVLLRRVGREFSLTFGDAQLELWFFRDVIGYGVEVCAASVAVFVLFFVLQMPDYTSSKPKAAWRRSFLTHWFRRTLPKYLLNLGLCYVAFVGVTYFGEVFFPPDVVKAVIVVGGTLLTVSWILVVLLSLLVHVNVRMATKHDAEYSFMIAIVSGSRWMNEGVCAWRLVAKPTDTGHLETLPVLPNVPLLSTCGTLNQTQQI